MNYYYIIFLKIKELEEKVEKKTPGTAKSDSGSSAEVEKLKTQLKKVIN